MKLAFLKHEVRTNTPFLINLHNLSSQNKSESDILVQFIYRWFCLGRRGDGAGRENEEASKNSGRVRVSCMTCHTLCHDIMLKIHVELYNLGLTLLVNPIGFRNFCENGGS